MLLQPIYVPHTMFAYRQNDSRAATVFDYCRSSLCAVSQLGGQGCLWSEF